MIRFYNGPILTLDDESTVTQGREVWVDDDMICYIGPAAADRPVFEREIDLQGNLLMPSFKNAHAHGPMNFLRSFADDLPLQQWLFDRVFPYEAKLTPEDVYALQRLAILEYLRNGISASFEMYYHRDAIVAAGVDSGFRTVLCGGLMTRDDWAQEEMQLLKYNSFDRYNRLVSYLPGIHSEYLASPELLMFMRELLEEYRLPFYAHNSETEKEVAECVERHGLTPTALFEEYGLFAFGGGGFHCTHMSERDLEIFSERGLYAVSCPGSNAKLASGIAPVEDMLRRGVRLALGTDGPASNNAVSMFREMYLAAVLPKLREKDAAAVDAEKILEAACCGSARAMNLPNSDRIAFGKNADLIVIDMHAPNMRPVHNVAKNLVYSGSDANVLMTVVKGKILYEKGGFHVGMDPEDIFLGAEAATRRLTQG